jgi:hypothetical protein
MTEESRIDPLQVSRPPLAPITLPDQRVLGALFPGVKQPGREADRSLPTSAEVKNMCGAIPPLSKRLHGVVLNHGDYLIPFHVMFLFASISYFFLLYSYLQLIRHRQIVRCILTSPTLTVRPSLPSVDVCGADGWLPLLTASVGLR